MYARLGVRPAVVDQPQKQLMEVAGPYLADFGCLWQRLISELDGGQQATQEQERRDTARTA